jgi:hypothetical protein
MICDGQWLNGQWLASRASHPKQGLAGQKSFFFASTRSGTTAAAAAELATSIVPAP